MAVVHLPWTKNTQHVLTVHEGVGGGAACMNNSKEPVQLHSLPSLKGTLDGTFSGGDVCRPPELQEDAHKTLGST